MAGDRTAREWVLGAGVGRRFTQDSPILPEVWIAYLDDPEGEVDLLLTPLRHLRPGKLAAFLKGVLPEQSFIFNNPRCGPR